MDVKSFDKDGVKVFKIKGEIDIAGSPGLRSYLEKNAAKKLVIDLSEVEYVDSSGLATLVEVLKKNKTQGGKLGLSGLSDKVRSLFEITKLDKLFLISPTQDEAVSRVK